MMVTYNRLELTKKTFETTLKNTGCFYNLIVVDNCSTDGTIDWLNDDFLLKKSNCLNSHFQYLSKNYGIAYGRSYGLNLYNKRFKDETSILCTLDNDVVLQEDWLKDCEEVLQSKSVIACGVNLEGVEYPKTKINNKVVQIKPKGNLGTACACFKTDVFDKIGYFNDLEQYAHEDAAYFLRMRLAFKGQAVCYLEKNGEHIGVGDNDVGEYRETKNKYWTKNMPIYNNLANNYLRGLSNLYVNFKEK
jgi:GT2 family glycosyltransferase